MGGGTPKTVQRPQKSWVLDPNMGWWDPKMGGGTLRHGTPRREDGAPK